MRGKFFGLLGLVVLAVYCGYLLGSYLTQPKAVISVSGFLVANLSIQPAEVEPNEMVTITVSVANTHDTWGIYSLVLQIDGVKEEEGQVMVGAGGTETVTFYVTRKEPGTYRVFVNGLSGYFTVVAPAASEEEAKVATIVKG